MNTYTNALHPKKEGHQTARNNLFQNTAIVTIIVVLVTTVAVAAYIASRSAVAAEKGLAVAYSNALEMQYARPWLEPQNKPAVAYSNALELQYARPWLDVQNKPAVVYSNALELQYAQPWLDKAERLIVVTGNAQEQIPLHCSSSMEMLYACKSGYGLP